MSRSGARDRPGGTEAVTDGVVLLWLTIAGRRGHGRALTGLEAGEFVIEPLLVFPDLRMKRAPVGKLALGKHLAFLLIAETACFPFLLVLLLDGRAPAGHPVP